MKTLDKINFLLDDFPTSLTTYDNVDYNSKLVLSFLFQPIFIKSAGIYINNGVEDLSANNIIKIRFLNSRHWSNDTIITADDFYKTLMHILQYVPNIASYLNFVVGTKEFLKGNNSIDSVKVWTKNNIFYAEVYDMSFYKELFSNICFSPIKIIDGFPVNNVTSGGYNIVKVTDKTIHLRRSIRNKRYPNNVIFNVVKNVSQQLSIINKNDYSYSGFTSLDYQTIINNNSVNNIPSNLRYRLILSRELYSSSPISEIKNALFSNITNNIMLSKFIKIPKTKSIRHSYNSTISKSNTTKKITILWADYYPNEKIVLEIINIFKKHNYIVAPIKLNFKDFLNADFSKYDLVLEIVEQFTDNYVDNWIEQIKFIPKTKTKHFVNLINMYLKNKEDHTTIEDFIDCNSRCINIGNFQQYYLKNKELPKLSMSDNGILEINKTFRG